MPAELGNWDTTYTSFKRWGQACASTLSRCGKKEGRQAIERSRGGLKSKMHVAVDELGNPVRWLLTGGEQSDMSQGQPLVDGFLAKVLLTDKGYDANAFVEYLGA
ncbi:transposase [Undibacterium crateris]|uniref:transposase n=1 Tax=Undibacterium crateris TaxID=2528175 RepID=UPI0038B51E43